MYTEQHYSTTLHRAQHAIEDRVLSLEDAEEIQPDGFGEREKNGRTRTIG